MIKKRVRDSFINAAFLVICCVYLLVILFINFSKNPEFYCTDMYSDMCYAAEAWAHKCIFPEGWVFGNQLYVVATPVLAAAIYGIVPDHCVAMGAATVLMGLGVLFSFNWMMKPLFPKRQDRVLGIVTFLTMVLFFGNPVRSPNSWQLYFTMCSYYACYAIAAFLAFGCYVRSFSQWSWNLVVMLILTCSLSFGTGMQSLRQTAVMVLPLLIIQILHMLRRAIHREKVLDRSLLVTGLITIFNLAGVVSAKIINMNQVEIFGNIGIVDFQEIPSHIMPPISKIVLLMLPVGDFLAISILLIGVLVVVYTVYVLKQNKNENAVICFMLLTISIAGIFAVDVFLTMEVREIYYFLLHPMMALTIAALFANGKSILRYGIVVLLIILFAFNCVFRLLPVVQQENTRNDYEEVAHYLEDNGISTVYSLWNHGEKIGISSDWKIQAGFWAELETPFEGVAYLCDPAVFDVPPSECAYLFIGAKEVSIAKEKAGEKLTFAKYFPERDIYIFTSDINLMNCE